MERPLPQILASRSFLPCTPPPLSPTQSLWNKASIARACTPEGDTTVLERKEQARADIQDLISPRADIKEAFLLLEKGAERTPAEQSAHTPRGCDSYDCMQSPPDSSDQVDCMQSPPDSSDSRPGSGQRGPSADGQRDVSPDETSSLSPPAATSQRASPTLAQTRRALKKTHPARGSSCSVFMPGLDRTSG